MQKFKTVREAAIAGSAVANPLSSKTGYEYGGLILKAGKGFTYTPPGTSQSSSHIVPADIFAPYVPEYKALIKAGNRHALASALKKASVVAFYHIHPCDHGADMARYFSGGDMMSMLISGFSTSYMAVNCTGVVYEASKDMKVIYPDPTDFFRENPAGLGETIGTM